MAVSARLFQGLNISVASISALIACFCLSMQFFPEGGLMQAADKYASGTNMGAACVTLVLVGGGLLAALYAIGQRVDAQSRTIAQNITGKHVQFADMANMIASAVFLAALAGVAMKGEGSMVKYTMCAVVAALVAVPFASSFSTLTTKRQDLDVPAAVGATIGRNATIFAAGAFLVYAAMNITRVGNNGTATSFALPVDGN